MRFAKISIIIAVLVLSDYLIVYSKEEGALNRRFEVKTMPSFSVNVISDYDNLFRELSSESSLDWRLLSAIAYQESRFTENIVSRRGAKGMMQVMPSVYRKYDITDHEILKPEVNIAAAIRLLGVIEKSLRFDENTSVEDRTKIILASYNAGIGHVADARRLAAKNGGNRDSWKDVAYYLSKKSDPQFYNDPAVRCGKLKSTETMGFVNVVMKKYDEYCKITS